MEQITLEVSTSNDRLKDILDTIPLYNKPNNKLIINDSNINYFCDLVSDFIIKNNDKKHIEKIISRNYKSNEIFNKNELKETVYNKLIYEERKEILNNIIKNYIENNKKINLEGFLNFRLKDYYNQLEKNIIDISEAYIANKEYEEFIFLLKNYVEITESKLKTMHIVPTYDGKYKVYDGENNNITNICLREFIDEISIGLLNYDDFLLSALLSMIPENIVIHKRKLIINAELLKTISTLFVDRITFCDSCPICEVDVHLNDRIFH